MHEVGIDRGMTHKLGRQLDQEASALGRPARRPQDRSIVILGDRKRQRAVQDVKGG
jgi:hypothetical protein